MDDAGFLSVSKLEEVRALWLNHWLAAWAPHDEMLRDEVLNRTRALY